MVKPAAIRSQGEWLDQPPAKITASELGFPTECPCCAWYSHWCVKNPRGIFPRIFGDIDRLNKSYYTALGTSAISPSLPPGTLGQGDMFLESEVIYLPGHMPFFLRGKIDILATFDGDQGFGVFDFKTANPRADHVDHYRHQLGAYALMMDRPAEGRPRLSPVDHLGLVCLTPYEMVAGKTGKIGYLVRPEFIPIERNDDALLEFISERVLSVLESPVQPDPSPSCEWCHYRDAVRREV
jgi:hypothetical protein